MREPRAPAAALRGRHRQASLLTHCSLLGDLEVMILARALELNTVVKELSLSSNKLTGTNPRCPRW